MADTTIRMRYPTAASLYTQIEDGSGVWNGSDFVSFVLANWTTYVTATAETPSGSGRYACQFPLTAPAGNYLWSIYLQAGATPASTDVAIGQGSGFWDGTTFGGSSSVTGNVGGSIASVDSLGSAALDNIIGEPAAGILPAFNVREMLTLVFNAACFGIIKNANKSPAEVWNPAGTVKRMTVTNDQFGNRTKIQVDNLP